MRGNFEALCQLDPRQLKLLLVFLQLANKRGSCSPSLRQLQTLTHEHLSWVRRNVDEALDLGHLTRRPKAGGGFVYRIDSRFLGEGVPPAGPVPPTGVPPASTAPIDDSHAPARLSLALSSVSKETSEREQLLPQQDEIPEGWEEAAAAERRLAGLGDVDYRCEWRKLVAYSEGARITIWRWRGWILKARGQPLSAAIGSDRQESAAIGDDRQQRQARDWARSGFWMRDGSWGPAPDQPGCELPAGLIAWATKNRRLKGTGSEKMVNG